MPTREPRAKASLRWLLAMIMVGAGLAHFASPGGFERIVPAFLPAPHLLVLVSGGFEILGGLGLLPARTRRAASLGLIALYVAVFPANVNMALHDTQPVAQHVPGFLLWLRLPLQALLVAWAWWVGRTR